MIFETTLQCIRLQRSILHVVMHMLTRIRQAQLMLKMPAKLTLLISLASLDPALIHLDKGARHQVIPESARSQPQKPTSTRELLDKPLHRTEARGYCASKGNDKHELPATSCCPDAAEDSSWNEFDLFIQDIDEMEASDFPLYPGPGSPSPLKELGSSTGLPTEGSGDQWPERVSTDKDDIPVITPATRTSVCDPVERETGGEDAYRNDPNKAACDNPPLVSENSAGPPGPDLCPSYPTPDSNPPNTPIPAGTGVKRSERETLEGNCSADQIANHSQSGRSLSNFRPAEEVALDNAKHVDLQDSVSSDSNFGNSEIESAIGEAHEILQDTLSDVGRSGTQNTNHELADSSTESLGCESPLEPQSTLPSRNLRPRFEKDCSEKQALNSKENPKTAGETSFKGALAPSGATIHLKSRMSVPSRSDKDDWNGRFSHHPLLSDLPPDEKDEIERNCNRILRPDLPEFIEKHTKSWHSSGFWYSPSLDIPNTINISSGSKGVVIWRYVEAIHAGEETYYLKTRFADIMLFLEYVKEFNRQRQAGHPVQTAKTRATNIICDSDSLPKAIANKTRKSFHEHKLVGSRWWWSGCFLSRGFFLLCSQETGKKVLGFSNFPGQSKSFPLDAFILYTLSNHPGIVACCNNINQAVDRLLIDGEFSEQLSKKNVQQWIQQAKATSLENKSTIQWEPWSTNAVASKASDFLFSRSIGP
ncbi:hypothetical protein N7492_000869 [Penicillium capsulatum]|uniref:Uncharacterized protein n=1 Tax=Penicillium capsulatum TaxID=69766 RepID=A0A9W9IQD9_9EURO|nr:hypothetical protein N7492_000869 [Penicillium capsulatum]